MFYVEVEINSDGIKESVQRFISLAMLCVRPDFRQVAINETRFGIYQCLSKLIAINEEREIKKLNVKTIAEKGGTTGDICKKGRIEFGSPMIYNRKKGGGEELQMLLDELAENITGGLIDFLKEYSTVLEYLEGDELKVYLVRDVDEVPKHILDGSKDAYKRYIEKKIPNPM